MMIRLNIGAGKTQIPGYTPLDIKDGVDAGKLPYANESVDEVYASHVLEHIPHARTALVLQGRRKLSSLRNSRFPESTGNTSAKTANTCTLSSLTTAAPLSVRTARSRLIRFGRCNSLPTNGLTNWPRSIESRQKWSESFRPTYTQRPRSNCKKRGAAEQRCQRARIATVGYLQRTALAEPRQTPPLKKAVEQRRGNDEVLAKWVGARWH